MAKQLRKKPDPRNRIPEEPLHTSTLRRADAVLKRLLDILLSLVSIVFLAPLLLLLAVLIKTTSPGPAIYRALRIGKNRKPFYMLKFRTMYIHASRQLHKDPELKKRYEVNYKLKNDSRVTKLGAYLRRTGLDELPQLFNVFSGHMSMVGPRPVLRNELRKLRARERFSVMPGLTGLWQIKGKNALLYHQKNKLDQYYAKHRHLLMDVKILLDTIPAIIKGHGFY